MRSIDWGRTALGPVAAWPQSLRTTVSTCLNSRFPILVWWGPDLVKIYNDAYRPMIGDKHPRAMGQRGRETWPEIWHIIGPMLEGVLKEGRATWSENQLLLLERHGFAEECYFTYSYSPIRVESGGVGGVFCAVTETTRQVLGERRLTTLRALAVRTAEARVAEQACTRAAEALAENPSDVPFALIYLIDRNARRARLAASTGVEPGAAGAPVVVDLDPPTGEGWPLAEAMARRDTVRVDDLERRFGAIGASQIRPRTALILPVVLPGDGDPAGLLVTGLSPRLMPDEGYHGFLTLVAGHVATAIANTRALEEAQKRADALAEIDRAKTVFFSNVSHEFRTPLTLMLGPVEDALARPDRTLGGAELETVRRNTLRVLKLVNSLLDFSRMEAGRMQASYRPTDLAALTRDLASTFRAAIEGGGVRFEVDSPPLPEPAYVDRDMWEKIVLNLLSNAFKFTLEGAITVRLRAAAGGFELTVEDTGTGIPEQELPRVFERFHRVEGARARTHEGSGIGLGLVKDLVALHGGKVEVASRVGAGTTFTVSVPRGKAHLPPDRIDATPTLATAATDAESFVEEALRWLPSHRTEAGLSARANRPAKVADPGAEAILVADDNADMRDYVSRLLGQHWHVEAVADGLQALSRVRDRPPALVVTDAMMPNLDGFGLLRELRADPRTAHVPVIILSARAGEESRVEGLARGADDYLVKPFAAKELIARVHVHLENARLRRAADRERDRLRSLLGQVPAVVNFLRGRDLVFEYVHPLVVKALGGRDVLGKPLLEALPELRDQDAVTTLRRVFETGEPGYGSEKLIRHDDGNGGRRDSYWNYVHLPVRDDQGRVEGVMTFGIDVTDQVLARRKIEEQSEQLERARAAAEAANRAKDEFLAMLGHELRNPLAPIVTALRLMSMRGAQSREQAIIDRQVRHLVRLVDDLLDISRITRGKVELKKERMELVRAVMGGLEIAGPLLEQRRQNVDVRVPLEGLPVMGDPDRLAQVVANLLTNSAKYSDPGTTVQIIGEREGNAARLRIRDEGMGIPPHMLTGIFDLFVQQRQSLDRAKGGLGLGLAIVRSLVELHGGTVSAVSPGPGKGSEFRIEVPLFSGGDDVDRRMPERASVRRPRQPRANGTRVLVVDDNVDAADIIADVLRDMGHDVRTANDGPSALAVAKDFRPTICLLDIGLPVMDGYELARLLRSSPEMPEGARIIAVTGYGQDADRQRSIEAGFNAHLVKPVNIEALERTIEG